MGRSPYFLTSFSSPLFHFAVTARINTAKAAKTKLATSENRVWCGCGRKELSPDRLKCIRDLMIKTPAKIRQQTHFSISHLAIVSLFDAMLQ
jgi:hypothetical protein